MRDSSPARNRSRAVAWSLALLALVGSLAAYDPRAILSAAMAGLMILVGVGPQRVAGRIAAVLAAVLLSALPWAAMVAAKGSSPDLVLATLILVPAGFGLLLLAVGPSDARRALPTASTFALLATALIWGAFGTTRGHFWLNAGRLETLATDLAATGTIHGMSLGQDGRVAPGEGDPDYDSYRFVNEVLVTHHPSRARPTAQPQPTIYIDDELRALGVTRDRYDGLRRLMTRAQIGYIARDPTGRVRMYRIGHGNEGDISLVFIPGDGDPGNELLYSWGRLAPHWFWVAQS